MAESNRAIDYFGMHHSRLAHFKARQSLRARRKMYELFMEVMDVSPATTVLDVGVTPDDVLPDSNAFEHFFPYPANLTATSIEDASFLEARFPGLRFVQTDGETLPFSTCEFEVAYSSAVLEHVGDTDSQRRFLVEVSRSAKRFFIATPNRWFPIEMHTFLPFVHWLPQRAHQWILRRVGLTFWAKTENLNLVGPRALRRLLPPNADVVITKHRFLGFTSNLVVYGSVPQPASLQRAAGETS